LSATCTRGSPRSRPGIAASDPRRASAPERGGAHRRVDVAVELAQQRAPATGCGPPRAAGAPALRPGAGGSVRRPACSRTSWRRRATNSPKSRTGASATGRAACRTVAAKTAMVWASRVSVFANRPVARAKSGSDGIHDRHLRMATGVSRPQSWGLSPRLSRGPRRRVFAVRIYFRKKAFAETFIAPTPVPIECFAGSFSGVHLYIVVPESNNL